MNSIVLRVAARATKVAEIIGDPKDLLAQFEAGVQRLELPSNEIEQAKEVIVRTDEAMRTPKDPALNGRNRSMEEAYPGFGNSTSLAYDAYFKVGTGGAKLVDVGHRLFLSIIQSLTLPPALRKKVEMASRAYLKPSKPRLKELGNARYLEMLALYEKFMATIRGHLSVARQAIDQGKDHAEGTTKVKVGDFTLVNTGGFSEQVMQEIGDVTQKCQALLQTANLAKVCYGDILVTNTLSKGKILAFYLLASDELFIRANVKAHIDTVQTVLHELGHRYEHKFLSGKKREIQQLFYVLKGQEDRRKFDDMKDRKPQAGEELQARGKTYRVRQTVYGRNGFKVILDIVGGPPGATAEVSLEAYLKLQSGTTRGIDTDPNYKGFVTNYASTNPSENFAEMFSYYCMKKLPVGQVELFEAIVR
jgi:hypothetical protein